MNYEEVSNHIAKIKTKLAIDPNVRFIYYVLLQLETIVDDTIPTACTNGTYIKFNPNFWMSLTEDEQNFLILHETLHVLLQHVARGYGKNPMKYNCAADYVINLILQDLNYTLINGALIDSKYKNMTTEQVYELLPDIQEIELDIEYALNPTEASKSEADINRIIATASVQVQMDKSTGKLPNSLKRFINSILEPKIDWRVLLRRYITDLSKNDTTWSKPNRRMLGHGIILPSLQSSSVSNITFAVDVSGSISSKEFDSFMAEVKGVFTQCNLESVDVILFDHEVQSHTQVKSLRELENIELKGYGGTNPSVAIEIFNSSNSKALFIITDGYIPDVIPSNKPVYWLVYNNINFIAPYGTTIHLES